VAERRTHNGGGKASKPVSEFRKVRVGTMRYEILRRMSRESVGAISGDTVESIAAAMRISSARVLQQAYHLWRDIGVGYRLGRDGNLKAIYPAGKTLADATRELSSGSKQHGRTDAGHSVRDRLGVAGDTGRHTENVATEVTG
jgi:hypothetical protein